MHNLWLTQQATNSNGETLFFLPALGFAVLIIASGMTVLNNWERVRKEGAGDMRVAIPLGVVALAIALSGLTAPSTAARFAPLGMALSLFALYICGRLYGKAIFYSSAIGATIASIGVILYNILNGVQQTGGYIFEGNYDIATGYILMGVALFIHKWRWVLASLALIAVLLTGAWEALFVVGLMSVLVLIRRDWGCRMIPAVASVFILLITFAASGSHSYTRAADYQADRPEWGSASYVVADRWTNLSRAMLSIKPLGEGYNVTDFGRRYADRDGNVIEVVHNVPLVLIQQLGWAGILAAVAWLWVTVWCLVRTRWKYAWSLMLALSVFDHFTWTQIGPVYWGLVGVSTTSAISSDLVFRRTD